MAERAKLLVEQTQQFINKLEVPEDMPEDGWGAWIARQFSEERGQPVTEEFVTLLAKIDERAEPDTLGPYLAQITPISKDIALEKGDKVRIMTLTGSKGLTVKATIIAGLETGLVPMDDCDPAEERRLAYVGMTRAEEYLFGTWARRRTGPTARMGRVHVQERRQLSILIDGGPVQSEDGETYLGDNSSV